MTLNPCGLYCPAGDFYIDPWRPVGRAVITHAHGDHARWGSRHYLAAAPGLAVLRARLGDDANIQTAAYGECIKINGVALSLHPAGHILGSSQIRIEHGGEVWVVTGDYKVERDSTCAPFEPVRCHTLVSESTFGLPVYRWPDQADVFASMRDWWRANQEAGGASMLFAYALGKAQRVIAGIANGAAAIGAIYAHGAVQKLNDAYRASGIDLPGTRYASAELKRGERQGALNVAPPSAQGTPWLRKFGNISTGFASGWMQVRGQRRRRAIDRGFVLSDHADWPGLLSAIEASGAERIWVTHGYSSVLARWLCERGLDAKAVQTQFEGERDENGDNGTTEEAANADDAGL
ncbi:MAG: ligase-associated DNA damage response exonuclease [Pseudomonadota bacterium]|nr:ligase-associated DNA damage response exonuclease [Pseudomonadota bacterium]